MPNLMMNGMGEALMEREKALEMERAREAAMVQARMGGQQMPQQPMPQQQPTISQYIAQMKAQDPRSLPPIQQPPQSQLASVPGITSLIQALMSRQTQSQPDIGLPPSQAGAQALSNQRHMMKSDDFDRERARAPMLQPKMR